jgi:hypothetical protein
VIAAWDGPFSLMTPEGTLDLNKTDASTDTTRGRRFQLNPAKCNAILPVRATEDDIPQGDGGIPHRRWRSMFGVHLAIEPLQDFDDESGQGEPACDEALVDMLDLLGLHLNAMIRTGLVSGFPNARLVFTPSGKADRMFDRCQLGAGGITNNLDGALGGTQVEVDFDTPYPYYIEAQETQTMLSDTGVQVIENAGNVDFFPVVKVYGPTSNFVLLNDSVVDLDNQPLEILYNASLPGAAAIGGGDYLEINFFTGEAFLNGSGADRIAGIDFRYSEFFPLVPGDNLVASIGASALVLSNGAWA